MDGGADEWHSAGIDRASSMDLRRRRGRGSPGGGPAASSVCERGSSYVHARQSDACQAASGGVGRGRDRAQQQPAVVLQHACPRLPRVYRLRRIVFVCPARSLAPRRSLVSPQLSSFSTSSRRLVARLQLQQQSSPRHGRLPQRILRLPHQAAAHRRLRSDAAHRPPATRAGPTRRRWKILIERYSDRTRCTRREREGAAESGEGRQGGGGNLAAIWHDGTRSLLLPFLDFPSLPSSLGRIALSRSPRCESVVPDARPSLGGWKLRPFCCCAPSDRAAVSFASLCVQVSASLACCFASRMTPSRPPSSRRSVSISRSRPSS
jgi:hypothetical protein